MSKNIRIIAIMPHPDDFEFTSAGFCHLLRNLYGSQLVLKIVSLNRGGSGHPHLLPEEVVPIRLSEAVDSAKLIQAEFEFLKQLDGSYLDAQVFINRNLLGGLWKTIRDFAPDVILCPPIIEDPLAAIHIDHFNTAQAVRLIAYQLAVPHAYANNSSINERPFKMPLIINVDDDYAKLKRFHIACNISQTYELKFQMTYCHKSQIFEWLPFIEEQEQPKNEVQWRQRFAKWHQDLNTWHGFFDDVPREYFILTRWGRMPTLSDIKTLFPFNYDKSSDFLCLMDV